MTYRITGIDPAPYWPLYGLSDAGLKKRGAVRVTVTEQPGFPCRVTLTDGAIGEAMLLVNHLSHDVANPYRARHAIFITEGSGEPATFEDEVPPALAIRTLSLRGFDRDGMMADALLAQPGEADAAIRSLLNDPAIVEIHAHNATRGCFSAKIVRT